MKASAGSGSSGPFIGRPVGFCNHAYIFTVVLDNGGWAAVKEATLRMYPDGDARERDEFASVLAPDLDFARLAESAGAYGEQLVDPAQTQAAIARCLAALREGRCAVLHVRVAPL